jgi:multiple sugar transport system permease protein
MSSTSQLVAAGPPLPLKWSRRLYGSDRTWAIAFIIPYAAMFVALTVYPVLYALWMGASPQLYADLLENRIYWPTIVNTLLFVGIGVNLKLFLAFLLSGFFMQRRWWIQALLVVYLIPWMLASVQSFISFHWMLINELGLIDRLLEELFGIDGPIWFNHRWLALGWDIAAYIWKWMPFWTLVFIAGRIAISRELYDAAEIDGAGGFGRFLYVTVPLLANLYLICTLLSTLWAFGDFATVFFVSVGGPTRMTEVLTTFSYRLAFDSANPPLAVAAVLSALPLLVPIAIILIRRVQMSEVEP